MALQEKLSKFRSQQDKVQSTLVGIAQSAPARSRQAPKSIPSTSSVYKTPPAPPKQFSQDTERLQHINAIRKSTVGAQIKRVIQLLLERRESLTAGQINEACYVDLNANKAVFDSLKKNIKVNYDSATQSFSYKAKHDIKNKSDLLVLIRKAPEGIDVADLKDAYPTIIEDLQEHKAARQVWLLSNFDSQEDIVYPNDPRVVIKVDDDLKQLFKGIELPRDMTDVEKYLEKNGQKPATNTAQRRMAAQIQGLKPKPKQKKPREFSKRKKLTNTHLPELLSAEFPGS